MMNLKTEQAFTPRVTFFEKENRLVVAGQSRQADPSIFYNDLWEQLEFYIETARKNFILEFRLDYISSGSSKWILHILKTIQIKYYGKQAIAVHWCYEEDDEIIFETGEVYKSLLVLPFELIEY